MPELPEVEITTRNLNLILQPPVKIDEFRFYRKNLRHVIPINKIQQLAGEILLRVYRRAKFIVFEFEKAVIVGHLGMTGSWRVEKNLWIRKTHDHIVIRFNEHQFLVYNDPRRFGEFNLFKSADAKSRFVNLGPEPLEPNINWSLVTQQFKKMETPIKSALMNQKYIVGVGNIYASEALYRAKIKPLKKASRVTYSQYQELWGQVQIVLAQAIEAGGSSIQDFRNGYGEQGNFQNHFLVYGRDGDACLLCKAKIKSVFISGRSTFWCPQCQK